jgi:nucleolar protein 6
VYSAADISLFNIDPVAPPQTSRTMSAPLTKKQQKALAFRTKQKAKRADLPEPEAVPEQDLDLDAETDDAVVAMEAGSSSKKRKRDDEVKGKGKGKKTAWDDDEDGDEADAGAKKKSKKEVKQRFILFVGESTYAIQRPAADLLGNLDFKTTREDIQAHFKDSIGKQLSTGTARSF